MQGEALSQNFLGMIYAAGLKVDQDYQEAAKSYKLAAEQGLSIAQYNLGQMFEEGLGVHQDFE